MPVFSEVGSIASFFRLLAVYSPQLPCLLEGAENYEPRLSKAFSGNQVKQYLELCNSRLDALIQKRLQKARQAFCLRLLAGRDESGLRAMREERKGSRDALKSRASISPAPFLPTRWTSTGRRRCRWSSRRARTGDFR